MPLQDANLTPSFGGFGVRSVWLTAPYFHDGSAATLPDVFTTGTTHNIAANISEQELQALIVYLRALPIDE